MLLLKEEWKKKWLEALRSGKYKQGKGVLQNDKGEFCCLGVLCDLMPEEVGKWATSCFGDAVFVKERPDANIVSVSLLPCNVRALVFDGVNGLKGGSLSSLMDMNDRGVPFKVIADYIEKNF